MSLADRNLADYAEKEVLILGLGLEGVANYRFFRRNFPTKTLALADQKELDELGYEWRNILAADRNVKLHLGKDYLDFVQEYEVIVKSPGINPRLYGIEKALEAGAVLTSATRIFFDCCKGKIIAVTGTKGKSTTCKLLDELLRSAKFKVNLIGNIGYCALDYLKNDAEDVYYVYEISSYQLEDFNSRPNVGIFTSFFPDHLDYHKNVDNYFEAKTHLFKKMNGQDLMLYNGKHEKIRVFAEGLQTQKIDFMEYGQSDLVLRVEDDNCEEIELGDGFLLKRSWMKLLGNHNLENVICAARLARHLRIDDEIIAKVISEFTGLKHRLEFVGEYLGVRFYNDSISTTPESAIAALRAIGDEVDTLILGGNDRGYDFTELAKEIVKSQVSKVILFPNSGATIWLEISKLLAEIPEREIAHFFVEGMEECVKIAAGKTKKEKACLLSCASPSHNLFKNFEERGDLFVQYLGLLAEQ